ncbi:hypothetical protein SAMN05421505_109136 [Sinosporangium album]|uniref:DUF5709 domain-containing protein n=1 Tax=Sinosporangium album TaxID=504805 RepID=A0A1G7Y875_9ACTN|nr:hypothetical protein [Sinosporangium album]SDG92533.1 hypothetical protein SAMN05421505_109136 [Sinosporangium album]
MSEMNQHDDPVLVEEEDIAVEAPEADTVEQHRNLREDSGDWPPPGVPLEADPADAADQARVVDVDEDDYR